MDICAHPEIIPLHGTTAGREPEPSAVLMPMFSLSKTNLHSDILVIPIEQWSEPEGALHWNEKEEGKLLWVRSDSFLARRVSSLVRSS